MGQAIRIIKKTTLVMSVLIVTALPISPLSIGRGVADSSASYVTLSSFSGHPGVKLIINGGGFQAGEAITVTATQNGQSIIAAQTNATTTGDFSTNLQLPAKLAQGAVLITAKGASSNLQSQNNYYVNPFTPALKTSADQSTPYGSLLVSGSGYAPDETVDLNFAGSVTKTVADDTGAFTSANVVTPFVPANSYQLIGAGEASGANAIAYQYINAFYASASPSSYYVLPLTSLAFNGSGFAANETVNVSEAVSGTRLSSFQVDADGAFSNAGGFKVPATYAGQTVKFVLTGITSGASTTTSTVVGKYYPNVSPTAYYVMPGGSVSFNGSGFVPGETVNVLSGTTKVASAVADSKGNLTAAASVTIPANAAGTVASFTLTGETSQGSGAVSIQVGNYNVQASPSTYYAMPGAIITFTGSGYAPGEIVAVFSGTTNVGSFAADNTGNFLNAGSFNIAYSQANSSVSYNLVGAVSKQPISFTIGVGQLNTLLSPSSYFVLPYANFSLTATGFAPSETVTFTNGATTLGTAIADSFGKATLSATSLPYNPLGSATLTATGSLSAATATASVGIGNYYPSVVADNYYARPGTTIGLTGNGFAPGETVTVTAGNLSQDVVADSMGKMTASLKLPFGGTTSLDIVSTGKLSHASSTTTITLAPYLPQVSPSTWYAQPGTAVTFTGSGFAPNEKVDIGFLNKGGTVTADAKGNLPTSDFALILPFGVKTATVYISGETSGASMTLDIGLAQFYAGLQFDNYYGNGGSQVTASGSGYAPNEAITITSGATVLATTVANAQGSFSKLITIPYAAPGKVAITATGSQSQAAPTTSFTVAQVYTSVGLANYAVPAGKAVTITGSGFFPGEPITVTNDRNGSSYSFVANSQGNLNDSGLILPSNLTPGNYTLTITSAHSYTSHDITMYVQAADAQ